ncbi:hypothetical protein ES705_10956 [subsurface metagenome]
MELDGLIQKMYLIIGEADLDADGGKDDEAREHLREAKKLLNKEIPNIEGETNGAS